VRLVALIRGVNVGGRNRLLMPDLRELCVRQGFLSPTTILQSGSVVFESSEPADKVEAILERSIAGELGLSVSVVVRSEQEVSALIDDNPFQTEAASDPSHLVVVFLKDELPSGIAASWPGPERFVLAPRHLYVFYPEGIGTSKVPVNYIDKMFGLATARNWNTVLKIKQALTEG